MSVRRILIAAVPVFMVGGAIAGGYAIGALTAPTGTEAERVKVEAVQQAHVEAEESAYRASRQNGLKHGFRAGRSQGEDAGRTKGEHDGNAAAEAASAMAAEQQTHERSADATPEELCAGSISNPSAYGQCLEEAGQAPAAPLTDYCAAHPEIVAEFGFCPSLNE